jgi:acyl-CoA thioesterase FadM
MRVEGKVVCVAHSVHCFIENNRPVAISKRLPDFFKALSEKISAPV